VPVVAWGDYRELKGACQAKCNVSINVPKMFLIYTHCVPSRTIKEVASPLDF